MEVMTQPENGWRVEQGQDSGRVAGSLPGASTHNRKTELLKSKRVRAGGRPDNPQPPYECVCECV